MAVATDNVPDSLIGLNVAHLFGWRNTGRPILIVPDVDTVEAARDVLTQYEVCTWIGQPLDIDWAQILADATGISDASIVLLDLWPANSTDSKAIMSHLGGAIANLCIAKRVRIIAAEDAEPGFSLLTAMQAGWDAKRVKEWVRRENGKYLRDITAAKPKKSRAIQKADEKASIHAQWREWGLDTNGPGGAPPANEDTVDRLLTHFKVELWYDEFLQRPMTQWNLDAARRLTDADVSQVTIWMQRTLGLHRMTLPKVKSGIEAYLYSNRRNCAQEWLRSLQWDGTSRLRSLMCDGFGTEDNEYYAAVGRNFMMQMVHRVLEPGCQADHVIVLEGAQGIRKSTALRVIGGDWFTECHESIQGKDFLQILPGHLLLEVAEMHSFRRTEIERIKGVISNRIDTYRASYGRLAGSYPRQCVFAATTNRDDWNQDDTGARRFWRVVCGIIDTDWIAANREQLFAEAVALVTLGEQHYEVPQAAARALVEDARTVDPWTEPVLNWLASVPYTTPQEVLRGAIEMPVERQDKGHISRVRSILKAAGWINGSRRINDRTAWVWKPPLSAAPSPGTAGPTDNF